MNDWILLGKNRAGITKYVFLMIATIVFLLSAVPQKTYAADIRTLMNTAELQPKKNEFYEERVDEILAECGYGKDDTYTVFKNCYDWLIHNVRYRTETDEYDFRSMAMTSTYDQTYINAQAFAPFYQGVGVCNEYAGALYIMAQAIGFQPYYCVGQVRKRTGGYTGHAWMALELNQKLYIFDPQVEDSVANGGKINYYYFGKTLDELGGSHILDRDAFSEFKRVNARFYIEGETPVYYTGIPLYIDEYPIDTYAVDGVLYVLANDLKHYGFSTTWDGENRTIYISDDRLVVRNGNCYHPERQEWMEMGTAKNSNVKVYLNSEKVPSVAFGDKMLVPIGHLSALGDMSSDNTIPEVYLRCRNTNFSGIVNTEIEGKEYMSPLEEPYGDYEELLPKCNDYLLYDIDQDDSDELIVMPTKSDDMCFFKIKDRELVKYENCLDYSLIWEMKQGCEINLYEKDNRLYILTWRIDGHAYLCHLAGIETGKVWKGGELRDFVENRDYFYGTLGARGIKLEPFDVSEVAETLEGAKKVEIKHRKTSYTAKDGSDTIRVLLGNKELTLAQSPIIVKGNTLIPMRSIFEALGANVEYEAKTKRITAKKDGVQIELWIDRDRAFVDGEPRQLPTAAINKNGFTMVPLRFVSEVLGADVDWNAENKTIKINL